MIKELFQNWVRHYEELLSDEDGTCHAIRVRGTDVLLEFDSNDDGVPFRGWLFDGESIDDIQWKTENTNGWPENLA